MTAPSSDISGGGGGTHTRIVSECRTGRLRAGVLSQLERLDRETWGSATETRSGARAALNVPASRDSDALPAAHMVLPYGTALPPRQLLGPQRRRVPHAPPVFGKFQILRKPGAGLYM